MHPGHGVVDVGAHLGFFTLAALRYGGPASRVIAVEPSASARRILTANLRLAGATDRVTLVSVGLGSTRGSMKVLTTGAGGLHHFVRPEGLRPDTVEIPILPLDELVAASGLEPTHIKIDVEGSELAVLEGGQAYLARRRPIVFLELHGGLLRRAGDDPAEALALLQRCGDCMFESHGVRLSQREAAEADLIRLVCRLVHRPLRTSTADGWPRTRPPHRARSRQWCGAFRRALGGAARGQGPAAVPIQSG